MKQRFCGFLLCLSSFLTGAAALGADFYVSPSGAGIPPFTDWASAATNIQDAIEVASDGDAVWVTNGVYGFGGKAMAGDLTNRVTLDKALTVQSVNGPFLTFIEGIGGTTGPAAVRGAWLTNGAVLKGFTLQNCATRSGSIGPDTDWGGGVWCASDRASLLNCIIRSNAAVQAGGAFRGTLRNSFLMANRADSVGPGAAAQAVLQNCTVISNSAAGGPSGTQLCYATNCIIYYNGTGANSMDQSLAYSCVDGSVAGPGVIKTPPQLMADGMHLANTSPCRGAGTNVSTGSDIFSQPWADPPSMGCSEWTPWPLIIGSPVITVSGYPGGLSVTVPASGEDPLVCWWTRDRTPVENDGHFSGAHTTNLVTDTLRAEDAGTYQVLVSNVLGVVTSSVAELRIHCVNATATNPVSPYSTWETAAANIQDAIEAATPNHPVLVADGVYSTGGKSVDGDLTNRVTLDKPLMLRSVNGPYLTSIQGAWDGTTKLGPLAVRCAWLTNGALLSGFTLEHGATRSTGATNTVQAGGGVWCSSTSAIVANCLIRSNAAYRGGGAYGVRLRGCALLANSAASEGGGAYGSFLWNCTVCSNSAPAGGNGVYGGRSTNCIIYYNTGSSSGFGFTAYCCIQAAYGGGNIQAPPQLLSDQIHLATTSPCRGAGANVGGGVDLDGQPFGTPPSIGCDEWQPSPTFFAAPRRRLTQRPVGFSIDAAAVGLEPLAYYWLKDGQLLQNTSHFPGVFTTNLIALGIDPGDAGDYQLVASNAFGMGTSVVAQVVMHYVDAAGLAPEPPFVSWATAATNIQDAIDVAAPGEIVLVTNGVYAAGGRPMNGALTNRVAITNAITVASVNGTGATVIRGSLDPVTTIAGPLATRCAWVGDGATLNGFTLADGGTAMTPMQEACGAGIFGASSNALTADCVISNNFAAARGGGSYGGRLERCIVVYNGSGSDGGGTYASYVHNSLISHNSASQSGGGAAGGVLYNCTVYANEVVNVFGGGGTSGGSIYNSIVYGNSSNRNPLNLWANFSGGSYSYSCTTPNPPGVNNITAAPQLIDGLHLSLTSPCRGKGTAMYSSGSDIDGEAWGAPPSMGCDEVWEAALTGPLTVSVSSRFPAVPVGRVLGLTGKVTGRLSRVDWSWGDGFTQTNIALVASHTWAQVGDYEVTLTAYNTDHPQGVSATLVVPVVPLVAPTINLAAAEPGALALSFETQAGMVYTLEQATNLAPPVVWRNVATYFSTGSLFQFVDGATNDMRFYRATIVP